MLRNVRSYENADDMFSSTYLPHPFNSSSEMEDVLQMEMLTTTRLPRNTVHRFDNSIEAKVEPGDTLQAIALRFHCSIADIKRLNKIDKENEIHAHKVIKIPVTVHNVLLDNFPIVHTSGNSSPKIVKTTDGSYSNEGSPGSSSGLSSLIRNPLQENEAILSEKLMVASVNASTAVSSSETQNIYLKMPDYLGDDQRKIKHEEKEDKEIKSLDEGDIELLKTYGQSQYHKAIKIIEEDIQKAVKQVNELTGIKESDTGLAPPALWDLAADKQILQNEQPLQVARCTKIINADSDDPKYIINVKQFAKFVVDLADSVAPTDIEEGMRVGVDRNKYQIHIPLPPKIDPTVTMMQVEDKPDVTYSDVGGCKEQIEKLREVVETPLLHPEKFVNLGIEPPKGVLLFGPPGTGKTLCARAVANRTDACFIRVIGSELVQKYVGEGARMVRELFEMARSKKACLIFFDEIDAIGGARFDDGAGGDNEVQRTMLELINQLDGFDPRGNIKVLMATNRPDTLDPALMRPGRLDRKVEFGLPDLEGRTHIFKIHARSMSVERDIRFELLARLCPNSTGAEIRSVCTEAGMFAIRARRKVATEKDFLEAVNKVIKSYAKFSATPHPDITTNSHTDAAAPLITDTLDVNTDVLNMHRIRGPSLRAINWSGSDCDMSWVCLFIFILTLCFVIPLVYVVYIAEHVHHNVTGASGSLTLQAGMINH
uniref:26S proteasome regulatory subunit 7 n=1 Tax=Glossina pallidipes TaxID=7398 RepID=A0A1A9ZP22_GLOPL